MGILLPLCYYQHSAGGTTNIAAVTINISEMVVANVASCPVMLQVWGAGRKPVFPLFPPAPPFSLIYLYPYIYPQGLGSPCQGAAQELGNSLFLRALLIDI